MSLGRDWIEAHLPQQGLMCLLDEVLSWDLQRVLCRSGTHRRPDHPLRAHGRLGGVSVIEYGAQAAAIHSALLMPAATPLHGVRFGVLASARAVELMVPHLDQIAADLLVQARCLHGDAHAALYEFAVSEAAHDRPVRSAAIAHGRLSVWHAGASRTEQGPP